MGSKWSDTRAGSHSAQRRYGDLWCCHSCKAFVQLWPVLPCARTGSSARRDARQLPQSCQLAVPAGYILLIDYTNGRDWVTLLPRNAGEEWTALSTSTTDDRPT